MKQDLNFSDWQELMIPPDRDARIRERIRNTDVPVRRQDVRHLTWKRRGWSSVAAVAALVCSAVGYRFVTHSPVVQPASQDSAVLLQNKPLFIEPSNQFQVFGVSTEDKNIQVYGYAASSGAVNRAEATSVYVVVNGRVLSESKTSDGYFSIPDFIKSSAGTYVMSMLHHASNEQNDTIAVSLINPADGWTVNPMLAATIPDAETHQFDATQILLMSRDLDAFQPTWILGKDNPHFSPVNTSISQTPNTLQLSFQQSSQNNGTQTSTSYQIIPNEPTIHLHIGDTLTLTEDSIEIPITESDNAGGIILPSRYKNALQIRFNEPVVQGELVLQVLPSYLQTSGASSSQLTIPITVSP